MTVLMSHAATAFALSLFLFSTPYAQADFTGAFEKAEKKAEELAPEENTNSKAAADTLETAGTVKTVSDWVGVTATAATIGTELYEWGFVDDEKLQELDSEYRVAVDAGNNERAEEVLAELTQLNEKKKMVAKDQASTQKSLGTIQKVAGFANLGAATGSIASAVMGYRAARKLEEGKISNSGETRKAKKAAKKAANRALVFGAGEAAVGLVSLNLSKKHKERADSLNSLADDLDSPSPASNIRPDLPSDVRMDIDELFDKVAVTKCGAGAEYRVLSPDSAVEGYDPEAPRVAGNANSNEVQYRATYNRIECLPPTVVDADTDTGEDPAIINPPDGGMAFCTSDVFACPDGSFVGRDASNGCQFMSCPKSTTITDASNTTSTTESGEVPRLPSLADEQEDLQMDGVGAEVEQN